MVFTVPEGTFEPLNLSPDEEQAIIDHADRIIADTLRVNEDFIANNRTLPSHEWKLFKTREKVQMFRQRKVKDGHVQRPRLMSGTFDDSYQERDYSDSSNESAANPPMPNRPQHSNSTNSSGPRYSDSVFGDGIVDDAKPDHIPFVIAHGYLPGVIEDVAFGGLGESEYTWRVRNSYVRKSEFDGYKVLKTIHLPTHDDPFRYLGIRWLTRPFNAFIKRRDFLFVEATGMALDSNEERIVYNLVHAIEFEQIPELRNMDVIRANFSNCYISRQLDPSTIEVYCRSFSDLGGDILDSILASMHSDIILAVANIVECSYMKKLTWQMQRSRRSSGQIGTNHSSHTACEMCSKSLSRLGMFSSGFACQICRKMLCSKCAVEKKITVDVSDEVTKKDFWFCLMCVIDAKKLSAWDVAISLLPPGTK
ncbi:hypothetical protein FI667_g8057, partial [Globisporangium splendens]